jgi:hypothetical protein
MMQEQATSTKDFLLFEKASSFGLEGLLGHLRPQWLEPWQGIFLLILAAWFAPLILAAIQGVAIGPTRVESFLLDPAVLARYLVALPLLFWSQKKTSVKLRSVVNHFLTAKLVKEAEQERFTSNIAAAMSLRRARVVDWVLLALAAAQSLSVYYWVFPSLSGTWRMVGPEGHRSLSLPGWWFLVVSQPIWGFVLLRYLYRIALWWRFLRQTSQLDLQLDAAHPDGVGGLSFLGMTLRSFKEAAFAISASLAGGLTNIVLASGAHVTDFRYEIIAVLLLNMGIFAGPLLFFHGLLVRTKQRGVFEYWVLWQRQLRQFEQKWMSNRSSEAEMLTVGDFSQVTDLSSILERVKEISVIPIRRKQIQPLLVASVLPFLPVLMLEIPIDELTKGVLKMAFGV